jgi:hypothetical protein
LICFQQDMPPILRSVPYPMKYTSFQISPFMCSVHVYVLKHTFINI